jgi:Zn-dependent M28 family amino/carboxypeptidase
LTAKFIAMQLSRWGFKPAGDNGTFFQKIALRREGINASSASVDINGQKFAYGEDFIRVSGNSSGTISAPIVYVGSGGWMVKSKNINPYEGIDVKGKLIAVYSESEAGGQNLVPPPAGVTTADLSGQRGTDWADAVTYARANGAAGVIILPSKFIRENWGAIRQSMSGRSRLTVEKFAQPAAQANASTAASGMPSVFLASTKIADTLFNGESGNPTSGTVTNSFDLNANKKISFNISTQPETVWTQNVVAIWDGSDSILKNEMVAVGAHYDHVGVNQNAPGADKIYNGADDDGSGTTGVLAMAEALAKSKQRPKRSILFVWHAGEEKGLWGAQYFVTYPTVDLRNVIAQLNIDMIGRSRKADDTNPKNKDLSGENEVYVIGSNMMSTQLGNVTNSVNKSFLNLNYNFKYDDPKDPNRFFFRSDHFHYAVKGIPIVFWFSGVHEDYHQPGDHADKIDYQKMEKITRTIFLTMWELADARTRPAVDKQLPPELTQR